MSTAASFGATPKILRRDMPALLKASYMPAWQAAEFLAPKGYQLDPALSVDGATVIFSQVTGPVVLFRGTVSGQDWFQENFPLIVGVDGPRHKAARELVARVQAKYGRAAHAIGHSLGGRLAEKSGARGLVLTADKATGLADMKPQSNPRQLDVRVAGDPVSALSRGGLREQLPMTYTGAHLIASKSPAFAQRMERLPAPVKLPIRFMANALAAHTLRNLR
jgi:hypothetical protein